MVIKVIVLLPECSAVIEIGMLSILFCECQVPELAAGVLHGSQGRPLDWEPCYLGDLQRSVALGQQLLLLCQNGWEHGQ